MEILDCIMLCYYFCRSELVCLFIYLYLASTLRSAKRPFFSFFARWDECGLWEGGKDRSYLEDEGLEISNPDPFFASTCAALSDARLVLGCGCLLCCCHGGVCCNWLEMGRKD